MNANPRAQRILGMLLHSIFFLFFLQLLTDFVAAVYAFGLLGTSIPPEIASVIFLFSPIILFGFRRGLSSRWLLAAGEVFIFCRIIETLLDTRGRMLVSGAGVALYLILLPSFLQQESGQQDRRGWSAAGAGLIGAVLLSFSLRAFNAGVDLSTDGTGIVVGWILALAGGALWAQVQLTQPRAQSERSQGPASGFGRLALLCLGLMSCLVMLYYGFSAPNVLARWMGVSYTNVLMLLGAVYAAVGLVLIYKPSWLLDLNLGLWRILNLAFGLALVGAILANQVFFPHDPAAYPLYPPPTPLYGSFLFWIAMILSPVILINFARYWNGIVSSRPDARALGGGFAIASFFLLVMIFAHVFTTVYDYIPVIGPFFRDKFWLVYGLAWAGMLLPGINPKRETAAQDEIEQLPQPVAGSIALIVVVLGTAPAIGAFLGKPRPAAVGGSTELTVMTYNLQQGYSRNGKKNYVGQLEAIRAQNPDVIGLQETDTNRISGGNADLIRYLADRLNYYSYYGPGPVAGTFGIALLSRYPILEPDTFYMYSQREQTATIRAQILVGSRRYNLFITHLGNGGPIVQQQAILAEVGDFQNVVLMGDFNFRPDTEAYALTTQSLTDSWLATWPDGVDGSGIDPAKRIDHIFVSPDVLVQGSHFLPGPASDHPALVTTLQN